MGLPGPDGKTPCEKIYMDFATAFQKCSEVFWNASGSLKEEIKKHLVFDSELTLNHD